MMSISAVFYLVVASFSSIMWVRVYIICLVLIALRGLNIVAYKCTNVSFVIFSLIEFCCLLWLTVYST